MLNIVFSRLAYSLFLALTAVHLTRANGFAQQSVVELDDLLYRRGTQPGHILVTAKIISASRKHISQFQLTSVELVTGSSRFAPVGFTTPMNYQRLRVDQPRILPLMFSIGKVANGARGKLEVRGSYYEETTFRQFTLTSESKDLPWNGKEGTLQVQGYYFNQDTPNTRRPGSTEFERIQISTGDYVLGESSISGAFRVLLPPGEYNIRGSGGLWSSKIDNVVTITSGMTTSLVLDMNVDPGGDENGVILESPDTHQDILDISFTRFRLRFTDLGDPVTPTGDLEVNISSEGSNTLFADVSALFSITPAGDIEATNIGALKNLISAQTELLSIYVHVGAYSKTYSFSMGRSTLSGSLLAEGQSEGVSVSNRLVVSVRPSPVLTAKGWICRASRPRA